MTNETIDHFEGDDAPSEKARSPGTYADDESLHQLQAAGVPPSLEPLPVMLKRSQLERILQLSRSRIYELMAEGKFPEPINYEKGAGVYWVAEEVAAWLQKQIMNSRKCKRRKA